MSLRVLRLLPWKVLAVLALLVFATATATYSGTTLLRTERDEAANSVRSNCEQIEQLKTYARDSAISENVIRQGLKGVISDAQKKQFQEQTDKVVRDLRPRNCSKLPILGAVP